MVSAVPVFFGSLSGSNGPQESELRHTGKYLPSFPDFRVRFPQIRLITDIKRPFQGDLIANDQTCGWLSPSEPLIVACATAGSMELTTRTICGEASNAFQNFRSHVCNHDSRRTNYGSG